MFLKRLSRFNLAYIPMHKESNDTRPDGRAYCNPYYAENRERIKARMASRYRSEWYKRTRLDRPGARGHSQVERMVARALDAEGVAYETEKKFAWLVWEKSMRIDFFIPALALAIEVNGTHHYKPTRYGGATEQEAVDASTEIFIKDHVKRTECERRGIAYEEIDATRIDAADSVSAEIHRIIEKYRRPKK